MRKYTYLGLILILGLARTDTQAGLNGFERIGQALTGFLQFLVGPGSTPLKVMGIDKGSIGSGAGPGKVVNGVNLLTGQPVYNLPLGGLNVRGVSYPIVLNYSGETKSQYETDNSRAPTSWAGLGFQLTTPFVATNHKGTYGSHDDVLFCNLGPYGGGQILLNADGTAYQVASNPFIKVQCEIPNSGEYANQFLRWTFTFPDGKKMVFGKDTNSRRHVNYHGSRIVASPLSQVPEKKFIYRWDLSEHYDTLPGVVSRNRIAFEYQRFPDSAATNKLYIRESHLKNIVWREDNREVERIEIVTLAKSTAEYEGWAANEPRDIQKLFETRRLDSLKFYSEGTLSRFYKFEWTVQSKSLLNRIRVFHPRPGPFYLPAPVSAVPPTQDSGWAFAYEPASRFHLLQSVTEPSSLKQTFHYSRHNFVGKAGSQDATDYQVLRKDGVSPIVLPDDLAQLAAWNAESNCDERFCYHIVKDGDDLNSTNEFQSGLPIRQKMYVEVRRNLGNFFDTTRTGNALQPGETITLRLEGADPWTEVRDWQFIPAGNYVLLVNQKQGVVTAFENDGVKWNEVKPFQNESRYHPTAGFPDSIRVYVAPHYFLVHRMKSPSKVHIALRGSTGWTSLNQDSTACQLQNSQNYGEAVRSASPYCLEWLGDNLTISAQPNYFLVQEPLKHVINAFGLNSAGTGFTDLSAKFQKVTSPNTLQLTGYNMNWQTQIKGIYSHPDYFLVASVNPAGTNTTHVNGFFFDGDTLREVFNHQRTGSTGGFKAHLSGEYAILSDPPAGTITFWQKHHAGASLTYQLKGTVQSGVDPSSKILIRTHPRGFTVEHYLFESLMGYRPRGSSGNYATSIYQVNRAHSSGYADRTSQFLYGGKKLFNVSFSGSDDLITGIHGVNGSALCDETGVGGCSLTGVTARIEPENLTTFVNGSGQAIQPLTHPGWIPYMANQYAFSGASRLASWVTLENAGPGAKRPKYRLYQYDGKAFGTPESLFVVDSVITDAGLDNQDRNRSKVVFKYSPASGNVVEFNSHLLLPQFEVAEVSQKNGLGDSTGTSQSIFHVDRISQPMNGLTLFLNGHEKQALTKARNGDTLSLSSVIIAPSRDSAWAKPIFINRPWVQYSRAVSSNKARLGDTTYFFNFNAANGAPHFILNVSWPEKIFLSQTIYTPLGFPQQTLRYRLSGFPDTAALKSHNPNLPLAAYSNQVLASSKAVFNSYAFVEDSVWREFDQSLTDNDLRTGKTPTYSVNEGWLPGSRITVRDAVNPSLVLERKTIRSKVPGAAGEMYASAFYEGLRSVAVAQVGNSQLANCAVLMAENGNAVLPAGKLDKRSLWSNPGTTFDSTRSRSGRYSFKVVDNHGPTVQLNLKDVRATAFGFTVSAWIMADGATPQLTVERFTSAGSLQGTFSGKSRGDTAARQWRRWEVKLTHNDLIAGGLFNLNNDYLRIRIGTGAPQGNPSRIVYVDDIVCKPSEATFGLSTVDYRGLTTSGTDGLYRSVFYDLGLRGTVMTTRSDENTAFGQAAGHAMGEN